MANSAVIPGRGGSKRIPRKNVKPFNGRPMIAWAIGAAKKSGLISRDDGSTDRICKVAGQAGARHDVVRHDRTLGYDGALHSGLKRAASIGKAIMRTMLLSVWRVR